MSWHTVTDAVVAEVTAWQARPLEPMYPVVFLDALRVKIRDEAVVRSKAVYLALAVLPDGTREVLGIWIEQTEGAKFWMKVFTDLKARGLMNCGDTSVAYISERDAWISRPVRPRADNATILSSNPVDAALVGQSTAARTCRPGPAAGRAPAARHQSGPSCHCSRGDNWWCPPASDRPARTRDGD